MILSLATVLAAVHIPLPGLSEGIGWQVVRPSERLSVSAIDLSIERQESPGAPITLFEDAEGEDDLPEGDFLEEKVQIIETLPAADDSRRAIDRLAGRKVYDFAQQMPKIVGGIGAYYIHIDYPPSAIEAGIEGRLVLAFVVEPTGRTNQIEVVESLHPACDSAAVRALRATRFIPGEQNGEKVSVRMRLPVRFRLLSPAGSEEEHEATL